MLSRPFVDSLARAFFVKYEVSPILQVYDELSETSGAETHFHYNLWTPVLLRRGTKVQGKFSGTVLWNDDLSDIFFEKNMIFS